MIKKLYAIRDVKADAFVSLMDIATEGLARRTFVESCMNPKSDLSRYPADYMLYEMGEYDLNSGLVTALLPTPKLIMTASAAVAMARAEMDKHQPALPLATEVTNVR